MSERHSFRRRAFQHLFDDAKNSALPQSVTQRACGRRKCAAASHQLRGMRCSHRRRRCGYRIALRSSYLKMSSSRHRQVRVHKGARSAARVTHRSGATDRTDHTPYATGTSSVEMSASDQGLPIQCTVAASHTHAHSLRHAHSCTHSLNHAVAHYLFAL